MADEADSKSVVGNHVWVQVPPPADKAYNPNQTFDDVKIVGEGFGFVLYI